MDRHQDANKCQRDDPSSDDHAEPDAETMIGRLQQIVRMAIRIEDRIGDLRRQFVSWRSPDLDYRGE